VVKFIAPNSAERNTTIQVNFTVKTTGSFNENTAVYIRLVNISTNLTGPWQNLCSFNTTSINGEKDFSCSPLLNVSVAGNYTLRASVNWAGCGAATPEPNTINCGDYLDRLIIINNHRDSRFEPLPGRRVGQQ